MSSTTASYAERVRDAAAEVERVVTRVGLRHQDGERPLGPEGARAERDRDRAVDPARDPDDGAAAAKLLPTISPQRRRRSPRPPLPGRSRGGRSAIVPLSVTRPVPASSLARRRTATMLSIESRFSGRSSSSWMRMPNVLLEKADQLEHSGRVDHPRLDERRGAGQARRVVSEEEVRREKFTDRVFHVRMLTHSALDNRLGVQTGQSGGCLSLSLEEMCGLAGRLTGRAQNQVDSSLLLAMAGELRHRGPDGTGLYLDGPLRDGEHPAGDRRPRRRRPAALATSAGATG